MKPDLRDPRSLRRHPLHKAHVPAPDKKSPEWGAFAETVHADGRILVPLLITHDGFVMDGWWRREAACDYQFEAVPCQVHPSDEAPLFLVESLTARKQMTRGAAVYLALGLLPEYAAAANARASRNGAARRTTSEERIDPRQCGVTTQCVVTTHASNRYLAKRWGCGESTVRKAREIRALLYHLPTFEAWLKSENGCGLPTSHEARRAPEPAQASLREAIEPLLFNGEKNLWDILQAAAGRFAGARQDPQAEQLELFGKGFGRLLTSWEKLTEDAREVAAKKLPALLAELPEDLQSAIEAALPKARKLSQAS